MTKKTKKDPLLRNTTIVFTVVILMALLVLAIYIGNFQHVAVSQTADAWGQVGDYFGGILNPIIGIATIYLILISIRMQREELTETRTELKQSNDVLNKQAAITILQGFEQSFFSWLSNYRNLLNSISTIQKKDTHQTHLSSFSLSMQDQGRAKSPLAYIQISGINALARLWQYEGAKKEFGLAHDAASRLDGNILSDGTSLTLTKDQIAYSLGHMREGVDEDWKMFYQDNEYQIDGLFRTLFGLIEWVDKHAQLSKLQKWHYVGIILAQLSQLELHLLFFYGLSEQGKSTRPFCEKFALFRYLTTEDIVIKQLRIYGLRDGDIYSSCAFNSNEAEGQYPEIVYCN